METTTWLEMTDPSKLRPVRNDALEVRRTQDWSAGRDLYVEVGRSWNWVDRLPWRDAQWRRHYARPEIELWTGCVAQETAGYFELERDDAGGIEIAYFGLRPPYIGRGFGGPLLTAAVRRAWEMDPVRVWLHTDSRDHPHALNNYLARGFRIHRSEAVHAGTSDTEEAQMMDATVAAIFIAAEGAARQSAVATAELVRGSGIKGDRNFRSHADMTGREVTLVEVEEIERFNRDHGREIPLDGTRRNIVTRGIRLNDLVGRQFTIGAVILRGIELCEPCGTLGDQLATAEMGTADVVAALVHRAGLRADIVQGGEISVGDPVRSTGCAESS